MARAPRRGSRAEAASPDAGEAARAVAGTPAEPGELTLGSALTARALVLLHEADFGGHAGGRRFRISHRHLRSMTGRPVLGGTFLDDVAMHLGLQGYDLIRMEEYVVVQRSRLNENLRRAPSLLRREARRAAELGLDELDAAAVRRAAATAARDEEDLDR